MQRQLQVLNIGVMKEKRFLRCDKKWRQGMNDKSSRGNASQFFVAGELCRRELVAVVTMGNTPNTDILCSNREGTKFVHIQVKTFVPGNATVSVGKKAEKNYGKNFIWAVSELCFRFCNAFLTPYPFHEASHSLQHASS